MEEEKLNQIIEQLKDLNKNTVSIFALIAFQIMVACFGIALVILAIKGFKI